jgi:hypothetical protein
MSPIELREGVRLIADRGTLRAILEVRQENCIHVALFDTEPQSPVELASGDEELQDDFANAKEMAVSLIAGALGCGPEELKDVRENIVWRLSEEDPKPPVIEECEERLRLEKQMLVALHNQLLCEEATRAAMADGFAKAKQEEDRAKEACEVAAEELQQHQAEHGC